MARKYTTDRDLGMRRIMRELRNARTAVVEVGVQEGSKNLEGLTIAQYAAYNEYGTGKIPERSFMRSTFDERLGQINYRMSQQYNLMLMGGTTVFGALSRVGLEHQTDIQQKILDLKTPPNAQVTIDKKGSDNPLIDSSAMINSIRYVVKGVR